MFLRLKGIEYLNFISDMYDVSTQKRVEAIKEITEKFDIKNVLEDYIQSYSHGMRQKLMITGSLLHDPNIWILDEPMVGLDPKSTFTLKEMMINHAKKGKTVLFSTHLLEVAEKICNRVAVINKGNILFLGTIEEMKQRFSQDESLEKMFLEMTTYE